MRQQRELVEFRTPQHPSLGTNNWGGASPMLARDIPKESLEQRYLRLNTVRTRDEIFPEAGNDDDDLFCFSKTESAHTLCDRRGSRLRKLLFWRPHTKMAALGPTPRRRGLFPKWDPKHRWPQGWC